MSVASVMFRIGVIALGVLNSPFCGLYLPIQWFINWCRRVHLAILDRQLSFHLIPL